jgi:hypothetical protein
MSNTEEIPHLDKYSPCSCHIKNKFNLKFGKKNADSNSDLNHEPDALPSEGGKSHTVECQHTRNSSARSDESCRGGDVYGSVGSEGDVGTTTTTVTTTAVCCAFQDLNHKP